MGGTECSRRANRPGRARSWHFFARACSPGKWPQFQPRHPILCVEPSEATLGQLGAPPPVGLTPVVASADAIADGRTRLSHEQVDAMWLKQSVHRVADPAHSLRGLANWLMPGGRLLVAMLLATIPYPLFEASLARVEELRSSPPGQRISACSRKDAAETVAATIRAIFAQPTANAVLARLDTVADMLGEQSQGRLRTVAHQGLSRRFGEIPRSMTTRTPGQRLDLGFTMEPPSGFEPETYALRVRCSGHLS